MESLWRDLKYGFRTLLRTPGFTVVAVLSLALGIGANTAIFTLTSAVFLHPLPVEDPARVLELFTVDHATKSAVANLTRTAISFANYKDFRDQNQVFTGLATYVLSGVTLTGRGDPKPEIAMLVSANYFGLLGVRPAIGRVFSPDEDRQEGGNAVTVLSWQMWQRLFGGDSSAIGKTVEFNALPYTVIGVMPPEFKGTQTVINPDLAFIPVSMHSQILPGPVDQLFNERRFRLMCVFGCLKPGTTEAQAAAAFATIAAQLEREYPAANGGRGVEVDTLANAALGFLPRRQLVMASLSLAAVVVGLVLLIACVNLANLLLARAAKRAREMGIRTALGAERSRLVRQLLTESLLLSLAGGAAGLALGQAGSQLLWSFRPAGFQGNSLAIVMDWRVFAFTAAVTLLTGILFGVVPAVRASVGDLGEVLRSGGGRGGTETVTRNRLRSALVVGQVTLAMVALAGAGPFIRSMDHAQKTNLGFGARNLFAFNFDIGPQHLTPERGLAFLRTVRERAASISGVHSAALSANRPLGGCLLATLQKEGEDDPNRALLVLFNEVSPEYFDTMRIPIIEGRGLTAFDRQGSAAVAVVSQAMAHRFWSGESALGKRFRLRIEQGHIQVVGVAANSVALAIGEQPQPVAYVPLDQRYQSAMAVVARTEANPAPVMATVLRQVQSLNANMALTNPRTVQEDGRREWARPCSASSVCWRWPRSESTA